VSEFSGIEVSGPMKVVLRQSDTVQVRIEADENLQEYIEVENDGISREAGI
jgi:hypothetical protein